MKGNRKFEVYQEATVIGTQAGPGAPVLPLRVGGKWRWREKSANGRIVAASGENFSSFNKAFTTAEREASLRCCDTEVVRVG